MSDLRELAGVIAAARNYFQARVATGETSIVLGPGTSVWQVKASSAGIGEGSSSGGEGAASEIAQLEKQVEGCRKCPLHKTRTHVVFGSGTGKSGLVFVGEAPGRDEDIQGLPFVGRAGQLLTRIIEAIDFSRGDVYITNVIKCRPEGNRDPQPHEIKLCSPYLIEQLDILKPRVICALGRFAAEALSGVKLSMADYRKAELAFRGRRVVATYHPAACLRNPGLKKLVWEDVQKLRDIWKNSE